MCRLIILLIFIQFVSVQIDSAKILAVFPVPSNTHLAVFSSLTQELAKRGHDVVVVTTNPAFPEGKTPKHFTEISVQDAAYRIWVEAYYQTPRGNREDFITQVKVLFQLFSAGFEGEVKSKEFRKLMNEKKDYFDVLIVEACCYPAISLGHVFNAPVIKISSFGGLDINFEDIGAYNHNIYYPGLASLRLSNPTMINKISQFCFDLIMRNLFNDQKKNDEIMLKNTFGENIPNFEQLNERNQLLILNINPTWAHNRPVPLNVVFSRSFHSMPTQILPKNLQSYLDNSTNGVIYISFGSNVDTSLLPLKKIQIMLRVLSKLPQNVLLKWHHDELKWKPNNVMIEKWFPQSDLLKHPNVKLFITQGGLQSTEEALDAGVPLLAIPMQSDQWYNIQMYEHFGFGKHAIMGTLTETVFENAVMTVMNDKSFRQNAKKIAALMQDQPQSPLSRAVWWTEYVVRHRGTKHLRSPTADMPWTEYYEIKLIAILLILILLILWLMVSLAKLLISFIKKVPKRFTKFLEKNKYE